MFFVIETMIGSTVKFSAGGPGKGMHSLSAKLMADNHQINSFHCCFHKFSDSGLFEIQLTGANTRQILKDAVRFLKQLRDAAGFQIDE